ncbi:hypothetical protein HYZ64_00075 [Candidatus Berkelbacteria bacterium]|nr:hypothetical protein [Candidatus Berkelbacteria bacterium]
MNTPDVAAKPGNETKDNAYSASRFFSILALISFMSTLGYFAANPSLDEASMLRGPIFIILFGIFSGILSIVFALHAIIEHQKKLG